ncbi:Tfp pilus assembly protein PilF [Rhodovulum sp. ES.010]|uniref:tetratricopeptide repeat protein n=1 Tax=Rhodovulum sp. ES.010 TaxID=1882821 RepID=UPI000927ABE2|nr:tetratricopeptide repeat protein [Rhodovulum sp. ES.010]SIO59773.1 Tfp pilus assembly protein PilF [Rhodovulum sp. ES.010]
MRVLRGLLPAALLGFVMTLSACQSKEEKAEGHYQAALALIEQGDVDRAIVELRNVFQNDGRHREARLAMARILRAEKNNPQGAYAQYLRLAEQYPDDLEARIALAEIAFSGGNWEEFERHGRRAGELAPEAPRVEAIAIARAYREAAMEEDAAARREVARQADTLMADLPDNPLLHTIAIDDALRDQDFQKALAGLDWMIEREPTNLRHYRQRLQVLARLGDMEAVEAQLRTMVERFPEDDTHKATLVRFLLSQQDIDAAEAFLRELAAASAPDEPGPTVDLIRFLAETRGAEAARAEIETAIAERPDPVPFQVLGAGLDFAAGRRDAAIATMESVLAEAEPSGQTRSIKVSLARMLLATGNEVGARTQIEEVLAEDPAQPEALKMQAAWLIEADDTDAALAALRTALDAASDDPRTMTLMAEAYARSGRRQLANEYLALAVEASGNAPEETVRYARVLIAEERHRPAEDILLAALRLAPENPELLELLGRLYLRMDDYGRAQHVADTLRRVGGEAGAQVANALEAERLNRQNGSDEAMAFLENLASGAEASLASKISLIRARMSTGDTEGALAQAQALKAETPDNDLVDVVLATARALNGDLAGAETIYRDLLEADPARPGIWLELVTLAQRQGEREAAKAALSEALTHAPENPRLLWAMASFMEQDGDIDGALEIYEGLYARDSGSAIVANNLASLLATYRDDAQSLDRAWTIARRLRDTEVPAMQDTYGWIAHRRGDSAEALPYLEAAVQGLPNDPLVRYHLGQVYLALDRPQDALEQFRGAIAIAGAGDRRPQIETARRLAQELQAAPDPAEN